MNPTAMNRHPLVQRLAEVTGAIDVVPADAAQWESLPGDAVLLFSGDPVRFPEALDFAVVLPELHATFGRTWRVGIVPQAVEDAMARRWAVQRWPSLVFLRDGGWLGTVSGMKDWDEFVREVEALLAATPRPRPAPTIAIRAADAAACH